MYPIITNFTLIFGWYPDTKIRPSHVRIAVASLTQVWELRHKCREIFTVTHETTWHWTSALDRMEMSGYTLWVPLANVYIAIENCNLSWEDSLSMAIVNSYMLNYQRVDVAIEFRSTVRLTVIYFRFKPKVLYK